MDASSGAKGAGLLIDQLKAQTGLATERALAVETGGIEIAVEIDWPSFASLEARALALLPGPVIASVVEGIGWVASDDAGKAAIRRDLDRVRLRQSDGQEETGLSLVDRSFNVVVNLAADTDAYFISSDIRLTLIAALGL